MLNTFDSLNRPIRLLARDHVNEPITLREIVIYGDNEKDSGIVHGQAAKLNMLGRIYKHYDEAGMISFVADSQIGGECHD